MELVGGGKHSEDTGKQIISSAVPESWSTWVAILQGMLTGEQEQEPADGRGVFTHLAATMVGEARTSRRRGMHRQYFSNWEISREWRPAKLARVGPSFLCEAALCRLLPVVLVSEDSRRIDNTRLRREWGCIGSRTRKAGHSVNLGRLRLWLSLLVTMTRGGERRRDNKTIQDRQDKTHKNKSETASNGERLLVWSFPVWIWQPRRQEAVGEEWKIKSVRRLRVVRERPWF